MISLVNETTDVNIYETTKNITNDVKKVAFPLQLNVSAIYNFFYIGLTAKFLKTLAASENLICLLFDSNATHQLNGNCHRSQLQ